MDDLLLRRLVAELDDELRGLRVDQVYALPRRHVALVMGMRGAPRLWLCTEPATPHLYLRPGRHPTPERPPAFAMAARKLLSGRRIESLTAAPDDRVVTLRCAGEPPTSLVFELIPRRATAHLVDGEGRVRAVWSPRRGRPDVGEPYAVPAPLSRRPADELDDDEWSELARATDADRMARRLARSIRGISLMIAREAVARHREGAPLADAVAAELERAATAPTRARIYSPAPLAELRRLPSPRDLLLAPFELAQAAHLHEQRHDDLTTAAALFYPLRATLGLAGTARDELETAVGVALSRTQRALEAVARDREAHDDPGEHRRRADLLLAYPDAEAVDGQVTVPDAHGGGEPVTIALDPALDRVENAQRHYRKARRAERAAEGTDRRRRFLEARSGRLLELRSAVDEASSLDELVRLARRGQGDGDLDVDPASWQDPEAEAGAGDLPGRRRQQRRPSASEPSGVPQGRDAGEGTTGTGRNVAPGIVAFRSSDGHEILVGRNARANDRLTHRMAAPDDWWLHAEGPGSHVVVRNPERADEPPADALREAASLAAHFSHARGATKVNVRWTRVRHLKRPRGGPPGQVILRRSSTVLAEPLPPESLLDG